MKARTRIHPSPASTRPPGRYRLQTLVALIVLVLNLGGLRIAPASAAGGVLWSWGRDDFGQLGDGAIGNPLADPVPTQVGGLGGVIAMSGGAQHSLALTADGTVWAWGDDTEGELGDGVQGPDSPQPQPANEAHGIVAVAAGGYHSMALGGDGVVWTWGRDTEGQLGDGLVGAPNAVATPRQIQGVSNVIAIAAGAFHSLALRGDGTVWAWGNDNAGQLGDGAPASPVFVPTPQQVLGLTSVTAIAAGTTHNLALRSDGTVWAWGRDDHGQLGDGIVGLPSETGTPHPVLGLTNVRAIAAGESHSLALRTDGTVWTWGNGGTGQLGDAIGLLIGNRALPVPLLSFGFVTGIAAGRFHSLALTSSGTVWAWGGDNGGQLGDGTVGAPTIVATPQLVSEVSGATRIASGGDHALALIGGGTGPTETLGVQVQGGGSVSPGSGQYPLDLSLSVTATPSNGSLFTGWIVDGVAAGWANPLTITLGGAHAIVATFAPSAGFGDVATGQVATMPILELAARGIVNGCDPTGQPPRFCPDEPTLRHQMAALIVRAMPGWSDETWPNPFSDPTNDFELMQRVATLGHYEVAQGYAAETCAARGKAAPCFGPLDPVRKGEVILFIARAMVAHQYWTLQPDDRSLFPEQNGTGDPADRTTQDHRMIVTYVHYAGAPPDIDATPGRAFAGWGDASPRSWFARALWQALNSYFAADRVP